MSRSGLARWERWQLPLFFALAFAITWTAQISSYLGVRELGVDLTNEANLLSLRAQLRGELDSRATPFLWLFLLSFGPTVAGVVVTALFKGRARLADLWARTTLVRIAPRWVAVVLALPLVLCAAGVGIGVVVGGLQPPRYEPLVPLSLAPALLLFMIVFTGLAEEVGWRGYALPELQRHRGAERASWILGVAWGLWHLPSNLFVPYLRGQLVPGRVIATLLALTVGVVGWTIVLTWIYNNTHSVFWIVVLHGWMNTVQSYAVLSSGLFTAQVATAALPWALAVYLLKRHGSETLTEGHSLAVPVRRHARA